MRTNNYNSLCDCQTSCTMSCSKGLARGQPSFSQLFQTSCWKGSLYAKVRRNNVSNNVEAVAHFQSKTAFTNYVQIPQQTWRSYCSDSELANLKSATLCLCLQALHLILSTVLPVNCKLCGWLQAAAWKPPTNNIYNNAEKTARKIHAAWIQLEPNHHH